MRAVKRLLMLLVVACSTSLAHGAVIGTFVNQGSGVFRFDVTNNDAVAYNGFNFGGTAGPGDGGFSGAFTQTAGPGGVIFNTNPSGLAFGSLPETYFFGNAGDFVSVNLLDSLTNLEGAYDKGSALIAPGQTITAAIFSTSNNTVPTYLGGFASNLSTTVPITITPIPEPGTMALVGLGAFGLVAGAIRRRRLQKTAA